jgi:hypothetical protein
MEFSRGIFNTYQGSLTLLASAIVVAVGSAWTLFTVVALIVICELARRFYGGTSRQLRALESAAKSPVYSTCNELNDSVSKIGSFRSF